jgi:2-haloacid dehalogenase
MAPLPDLRALCFDVFGTVVDWRSGVAAAGRALAARLARPELQLDWAAFADDWRAGYAPALDEVRHGRLPWTTVDALHRRILERLLAARGLALAADERAELNAAWHRLPPWPDSVAGLARLKARWPVCALSNGDLRLLLDMARAAALPWDLLLSAELFGHYKPDAEVYLGACRLLALAPGEVLMVAAHPADLRGARAAGLRTAYVRRPLEHGPGSAPPAHAPGEFDLVADDFIDLARQLGA